jgi:hypothetical protein
MIVVPSNPQSPTRAVITIATTKTLFVEMTFALARSFRYWNDKEDISFHLVTDLDFELPLDLSYVQLIRVKPGELGEGFSPKLHLDRLAPAQQTLFIDADCLCFGPLNEVFDRFRGRAVSVVGDMISTGLWWGDIEKLRARFNLKAMPQFNGGIYYVEPGNEATNLYKRARVLVSEYDEIGLVRLRGRPNDEIVMSITMAEFGLLPVENDGSIMATFYSFPLIHKLSVLGGYCQMSNPPLPHPMHHPTAPIARVTPRIAHFLDSYTDHWRYRAEALKLRLIFEKQWPKGLAQLVGMLTVALPGRLMEAAKNIARPFYHMTFGPRRLQPSKRL